MFSKRVLIGAAALAAAVIVVLAFARGGEKDSGGFETAAADKGPVTQAVSTSGAVQALVTVDVGSQLSGQILKMYADYNDEVKAGELLALLDPQTYQTRVAGAEADLTVARATLLQRQADLAKTDAMLAQKTSDFKRLSQLGDDGGVAPIDLDAARAQLAAAKADVQSVKAQIENANANIKQRESALEQAKVDLDRTQIRAPIDGVVIERAVDVGQTVAASLQAPLLFQIAQDLGQIQIEASVNEADIGAVKTDQSAHFTVDAYPNRKFSGVVDQVRLAPTTLQNVVTYTVIIRAQNPGKILFPGMTATVEIVTGARKNVLRVPNAAARFQPSGVDANARTGRGGGNSGGRQAFAGMADTLGLTSEQTQRLQTLMRARFQGERGGAGGPPADPSARRQQMEQVFKQVLTDAQWAKYQEMRDQPGSTRSGVVWVVGKDGAPEPRRVRFGLSDTQYTEIAGGDLSEGDRVIVREARTS